MIPIWLKYILSYILMNKSLRLNSPSSEYVIYEKILGRGSYGVVLLAK